MGSRLELGSSCLARSWHSRMPGGAGCTSRLLSVPGPPVGRMAQLGCGRARLPSWSCHQVWFCPSRPLHTPLRQAPTPSRRCLRSFPARSGTDAGRIRDEGAASQGPGGCSEQRVLVTQLSAQPSDCKRSRNWLLLTPLGSMKSSRILYPRTFKGLLCADSGKSIVITSFSQRSEACSNKSTQKCHTVLGAHETADSRPCAQGAQQHTLWREPTTVLALFLGHRPGLGGARAT